jgi:hypothetical protein
MSKQKVSQKTRIQKFMATGRKLSEKQALSMFGTQNLSARVDEIRKSGVSISTTKNTKGSTAYQILPA